MKLFIESKSIVLESLILDTKQYILFHKRNKKISRVIMGIFCCWDVALLIHRGSGARDPICNSLKIQQQMIIDFYNKKTPKTAWCDVCRCLTQLLIGSRCYHYFTSAKVFSFGYILIRWWLLCKCRPTGNVSNDVPVELRWWLYTNHIFFIQRLYRHMI